MERCFHSPNTPSWRGAQLKRRDNSTSTSTAMYLLTRKDDPPYVTLRLVLIYREMLLQEVDGGEVVKVKKK
jgi:hypothetical protein